MDIASLAFRTFVHATEDEDKVEQALRFVSGAEEITKKASEGYHGNPITVLEARISRSREIKAFLSSLSMDEVRHIREGLDSRMDEESMFFLRLDKQAAYQGNITLANHDDIISVRGKVKSYPQSRDNALKILDGILQELLEERPRRE